MEKDAAEAFTLADAEGNYGKFLPERWPTRGTDRSGRLEAFLTDPQCGAWETRANFKRGLFASCREPELQELLRQLTEPERPMFLALRGIVRGGGPSAEDGSALQQPANVRIRGGCDAGC
eukprot:ctg_1606.g442